MSDMIGVRAVFVAPDYVAVTKDEVHINVNINIGKYL
jgi:uncharacterized protein YrrD